MSQSNAIENDLSSSSIGKMPEMHRQDLQQALLIFWTRSRSPGYASTALDLPRRDGRFSYMFTAMSSVD